MKDQSLRRVIVTLDQYGVTTVSVEQMRTNLTTADGERLPDRPVTEAPQKDAAYSAKIESFLVDTIAQLNIDYPDTVYRRPVSPEQSIPFKAIGT